MPTLQRRMGIETWPRGLRLDRGGGGGLLGGFAAVGPEFEALGLEVELAEGGRRH